MSTDATSKADSSAGTAAQPSWLFAAAAWTILTATGFMAAGCGEAPPAILPAVGVVTLNGQPLARAQVRFVPKANVTADFIAVGETNDNGQFELKCQGAPGACAGENIVTVADADIPRELQAESKQAELAVYLRGLKNRPIPPRYATPVQTPLTVNVTEGQSEFNLELTR